MIRFHLGGGLTEYFLYNGVASGEEVTHKIYICRARVGATKTLRLAVKVEFFFFFNDNQDQLLHRGWRGFMRGA